MLDPQVLPGLVLVGVVEAVVLVTLLAVGFSRPGSRRAGLVAGGIPLALLPPAVATAYASWKLLDVFSGMAQAQTGGMHLVLEACSSLWRLERLAFGAFAVSCVCGLVLGLLRFGPPTDEAHCSVRRGLVLVLLPLLGLVLVGGFGLQLGRALRVSVAVVSPQESDPESKGRAAAILEAEGLEPERVGPISEFIGRALLGGTFGGFATLAVLMGLALPGFILAWRIDFGAAFTALATGLWLVAAVGASLLAIGMLDPLRLP